MSQWARIDNSTVMELTDVDPTDRFNPALVWVMVPDNEIGTVQEGFTFNSGAFTAPSVVEPMVNPLTAIEGLIQNAFLITFRDDPLPVALRIEIAQLQASILPLWSYGDFESVEAVISSFTLPTDGSITSDQTDQCEALIAQILALVPGV